MDAKYVSTHELHRIASKGRVQTWSYADRLRSVRVGQTIFKEAFADDDELECLVGEFRAAGGKGLPSSFGDVFHRLYPSPPIPRAIEHLLAGARVAAGWQQAIARGQLEGVWNVYDLVSAYRWAAEGGLPEIRSAFPCKIPHPQGIYVGQYESAGEVTPPNLPPGRRILVTGEEIYRYDLHGFLADCGVGFRRNDRSIVRQLSEIERNFTSHKKIFRAFWGAWIAQGAIHCEIREHGKTVKSWASTRKSYNAPWASSITGRVRMRVADHAEYAAHVFVDSVMVNVEIPSGNSVGDWKLVRRVTRPFVRGAGNYSGDGKVIKHAGVKLIREAL